MFNKTVALVTGANRGLGLEIARQLGQRGLAVVLGARNAEQGALAADVLKKEGIDARSVVLDVGQAESIAAMPTYFEKETGRLDVLVNNAGVALWGQTDMAAIRATFETNFFGVVALTTALLPLLQKSPAGRIVNQSSILGSLTTLEKSGKMMADFITVPYTTSKAALNAYTVALAHQLRDTTVKVNSAHPGWVRTELGGPNAPLDVVEGAKTAVRLATLDSAGPSGEFFHLDDRLPW